MAEHRALRLPGRAAGEDISAIVARVTGAAGNGSARRAWSGKDSIQTIGRLSSRADASVWRWRRRAWLRLGNLPTKSTVWRTSSGTATPPAWAIERNANPHSGRFTAQRIPIALVQTRLCEDPCGARDGRGEVTVPPRPSPEERPNQEGRPTGREPRGSLADEVDQGFLLRTLLGCAAHSIRLASVSSVSMAPSCSGG